MRGLGRIPFAAWVALYLAALAIVCHFVLSQPWLSSVGAAGIIYVALVLYWAWEGRRASRSGDGVRDGGKHRASELGTADQQVR